MYRQLLQLSLNDPLVRILKPSVRLMAIVRTNGLSLNDPLVRILKLLCTGWLRVG